MRSLFKNAAIVLIIVSIFTVTVQAKSKIDLTAPHEVPTVEELEAGLLYNMKSYAATYLEAAQEYGINVYALCAIDASESGWGRYTIAKNNLGGWRQNSGEYMPFTSVEEAIFHKARNLKRMYLTPKPEDASPDDITGKYFNGYDLAAINQCYNGSDQWLELVSGIWVDIEWRIEKHRLEQEDSNAND